MALAAFFSGVLLYQFSPRKGETSALTKFIGEYQSKNEDWEQINQAHVDAVKQASYDRTLFFHGNEKQRFVDVSYPEYVDRAGSTS